MTESARERRKRREVEVGLANNAVGAGAGTIATASAVRAVRGHDYKPKTKLGAKAVARMGRMGVSPKRAILAAGVGNVALQAGNGLLDAQSAGYFARERAKMGSASKSLESKGLSKGLVMKASAQARRKRDRNALVATAGTAGVLGAVVGHQYDRLLSGSHVPKDYNGPLDPGARSRGPQAVADRKKFNDIMRRERMGPRLAAQNVAGRLKEPAQHGNAIRAVSRGVRNNKGKLAGALAGGVYGAAKWDEVRSSRRGVAKGLEMRRGTFDQGNGRGRRITEESVAKALSGDALASWASGGARLRDSAGNLSGKVKAPRRSSSGVLQVDPRHPSASNHLRNGTDGPRKDGRVASYMTSRGLSRRNRDMGDFRNSLAMEARGREGTADAAGLWSRVRAQDSRMAATARRQLEMRSDPSKRRVPLTAKNTRALRYREDPVGKARRFDAEADRQRRMGLYSGAAAGGALVAAHTAKPQWTLTDSEGKATKVGEGKKIHGVRVLNRRKGVGRAALAAGLGTAAAGAYARGVSARNQPWT